MEISLTVQGMHCKSCKMLIEEELEDIGAQDIQIVLNEASQTGKVHCTHPNREAVIKAIQELGDYTVQ